MTYRAFSIDTWQDPWFEKLTPQAKLLHIYLWTNDVCRQSGCYQLNPRRAEFETGVPFDATIKLLAPKIEWFPASETVWIKAFLRWQCANKSFFISAIRSLAKIDSEIVDKFIEHNADLFKKYGVPTVDTPCRQGVPTVPTPCPDGDHTHPSSVSVTGTDTVTDTGEGKGCGGNQTENAGASPAPQQGEKKLQRKKQLPPDFLLTPEMDLYAVENGIEQSRVDSVFEHFCDHHRAKGSTMLDWEAAWRTWVQRDRQFRRKEKDSDMPPSWSDYDKGKK